MALYGYIANSDLGRVIPDPDHRHSYWLLYSNADSEGDLATDDGQLFQGDAGSRGA